MGKAIDVLGIGLLDLETYSASPFVNDEKFRTARTLPLPGALKQGQAKGVNLVQEEEFTFDSGTTSGFG